MTQEIAYFVNYLIYQAAREWNRKPSWVYKKLQDTGCINDYLVSFYDVLHTMGTQALVTDMATYLDKRGVKV